MRSQVGTLRQEMVRSTRHHIGFRRIELLVQLLNPGPHDKGQIWSETMNSRYNGPRSTDEKKKDERSTPYSYYYYG